MVPLCDLKNLLQSLITPLIIIINRRISSHRYLLPGQQFQYLRDHSVPLAHVLHRLTDVLQQARSPVESVAATTFPPIFYPCIRAEKSVGSSVFFESSQRSGRKAIFRFESREERRDEGGKGGGEEGQGKDCGNRASDAALVEGRPENLRPGIHPFSDIPRQQGNFLGCTSPVHQDGHGSLRIHYSRSVKLFITSRIRSWRPGERRPRT